MNTLVPAPPSGSTEHSPVTVSIPERALRRRFPAVSALLAGGATVVAAALFGLHAFTEGGPSAASRPTRPAGVEAGSRELTADIGMTELTYEPGHSSGWHVHPGVHAVVVLSGTLTIYDQDCRLTVYGPGASYLGGAEPHIVRNETAEPVSLVATKIFERSSPMGAGISVAPPAGCGAR